MPIASPSAPPMSAPNALLTATSSLAAISELQVKREIGGVEQTGHIFDRPAIGLAGEAPGAEEGATRRAAEQRRIGVAQHLDIRPFLAAIGYQPGLAQRLGQRARAQAPERHLF